MKPSTKWQLLAGAAAVALYLWHTRRKPTGALGYVASDTHFLSDDNGDPLVMDDLGQLWRERADGRLTFVAEYDADAVDGYLGGRFSNAFKRVVHAVAAPVQAVAKAVAPVVQTVAKVAAPVAKAIVRAPVAAIKAVKRDPLTFLVPGIGIPRQILRKAAPKVYQQTLKKGRAALPYAAIAAGVAATVVTGGAALPALVGAGGAVAGKVFSDKAKKQAQRDAENAAQAEAYQAQADAEAQAEADAQAQDWNEYGEDLETSDAAEEAEGVDDGSDDDGAGEMTLPGEDPFEDEGAPADRYADEDDPTGGSAPAELVPEGEGPDDSDLTDASEG